MSNAVSRGGNTETQSGDAGIQRAARGSALNLAGAAVSAVATFGLTVLIAHAASKTDAGVFFSATSLFVLVTSLGQLGTNNGLVYFVARSKRLGEPEFLNAYLRVASWPVLFLACGAAAVLFIFAQPIASALSPDQVRPAGVALRILAIFVPFATLENVLLSASRGLGTMRPNTLVEQILRPGLQVALAGVIILTGSRLNLSWSWGLPYAVAVVGAWVWWRRLVAAQGAAQVKSNKWREFWNFSSPRSVAGVAQVAMQRLDIVLVGAFAGAPAAAVYTAATRFVVLGQLARNAVSLAVQPQLAAAMADNSRAGVRNLYQLSTAWLMAVSWPIYLVLMVDSPALMGVFGRGYGVAHSVLVMLSISMLAATLCGDVDVMLIMSGRTRWSLINVTSAFSLNLGLDLWLIPQMGINGAAIGWSVAIVVKNLMALIQVALVFRLHPLGRATLIVIVCSVLSFAGIVGLARAVLGTGSLSLVVGCVTAVGAYGAALWFFRRDLQLGAFVARRRFSSTAFGSSDVTRV